MSTPVLRVFNCLSAMAAGLFLFACTTGTPIGHVNPDGAGATDAAHAPELDPGPGCAAAPSLFMSKCIACHSAAAKDSFGGFDLETAPLAQRLIGVLSPGANATSKCGGKGPYLVAGSSPATGLLLDKISNSPPCGVRMPQIGTLSPTEIECIQLWANQVVATAGGSADAGVNYDVGVSDRMQGDARPDAVSLETAPDVREPPFMIAPDLLGTWMGYFEGFALESGSDAIKISLLQTGDTSGRIELTLGAATSLPPVTDPAAPWPTADYALNSPVRRLSPSSLEGVVYSARSVQWVGRRLRFAIAGAQAWQPWCSQQTVYPVPGTATGYSCIPGMSVLGTPERCFVRDGQGTEQEISCARALMCGNSRFCACYGDGCIGDPATTDTFDMTFDAIGATVAGTASLGGRTTIRLMKTAP